MHNMNQKSFIKKIVNLAREYIVQELEIINVKTIT